MQRSQSDKMELKTLQKRYLEEVMLLQLMDILSSLVRKAGLLIYGQSGKSRGIQTDTEYLKQDSMETKLPFHLLLLFTIWDPEKGLMGSFVIGLARGRTFRIFYV